jgi:hypothetical protein
MKAMSVPGRMGTNWSADAEVRLNRGSTWMILVPAVRASIAHWNPTGCASAKLEPMMSTASLLGRSWR